MLYMKFIITESKLVNAVENLLNKQINSDKFNWVDKIDVKKSSTNFVGWKESYPVNNYIIYFKEGETPSYEIQSQLFDKISLYHSLIFNREGDENRTYFSTSSVLPDGKTSSFPYFNV